MVVAGQRDHAAMRRGAGGIAVLQHVHRAVDAGALAVPDREHAIDGGAGEQVDLLRAPHRGGGEVLVEAGLEVDVVFLEVPLRRPQRVVVHAERRAAITRDEAAGVEPGGEVALALHHRQAHQRLDAGEIDAALVEPVAVFQGVVAENEGDGVTVLIAEGPPERRRERAFMRREHSGPDRPGERPPGPRRRANFASSARPSRCRLAATGRVPWATRPSWCIATQAAARRCVSRSPSIWPQRFDAHVIGLHVRQAFQAPAFTDAGPAMDSLYKTYETVVKADEAIAAAAFREAVGSKGISSEWRVADGYVDEIADAPKRATPTSSSSARPSRTRCRRRRRPIWPRTSPWRANVPC